MKKLLSSIVILFLFNSCGTMEKNDRMVQRSDFFNQFSKSKLNALSNWKMGDDYLKLRKNKTFLFQARVFGIVRSGYYAGKYTFEKDTLRLTFINNYKPEVLKSGILVLKKRNGEEILETDNGYYLAVVKNEFATK